MQSTLGNWITNGTDRPFYARRRFRITKEVKSAEARVCGLGQFLFWMNGRKVGDHELDPGWTNYRKLIEYVTFDVTSYLQEGENVLGAEVGNGWFIKTDEHYTFAFPPFMPPNPNPYRPFGTSLVLALTLEITYADGTTEAITADERFQVKEHPVVMSNVYGSETIDGRLAQKDWSTIGYDASGWKPAAVVPGEDAPQGELIEQFQPAVKVVQTYEGRRLGEVTLTQEEEKAPDGDNVAPDEAAVVPDEAAVVPDGAAAAPDGEGAVSAQASETADGGPTGESAAGGNQVCAISREIYDFGQNMSGILEFEVRGKAGDRVQIYPAEKLAANGDVDQMAKGWVNLDSCITYIVGGDDVWETCRMKFTYFAGRYIALERYAAPENESEQGASSAQAVKVAQGEQATLGKTGAPGMEEKTADPARIEIRAVRAHAITSAYETDGSFICDDERLNQIYDMIEKTVEANMLGVHTDCPTIERFAWQEPNHLMAPSIFYMKNGRKLWEKFLLDMRTEQHTAADYFFDFEGNKVYPGDGLMPSQCPCYIPNVLPVPGMGSFYDIIAWGSTCILGTWWHYQFYGDLQIVKDNYEAGKRYFAHLQTKVTEDGFINHGLGDWGNPRNELARENVETAFLYADAVTLEKFAALLGEEADREEYARCAAQIKENYNAKLLVKHPEQGFCCYRAWDHADEVFLTPAIQALPLFWGLVPEDKEADVAQALRYTLERDGAFVSGEVGLPYIIQSARRYGMNDLIARFIVNEEHPSYYAFILDGETTLGEYWEKNPSSHCHDMMGHIIEWYYNGMAGILPEEPGFKKVTIRPFLPESVHAFTCGYRSASGPIRVSVREEDGKVRLRAEAAEGIVCTVDTSNLESRGEVTVEKGVLSGELGKSSGADRAKGNATGGAGNVPTQLGSSAGNASGQTAGSVRCGGSDPATFDHMIDSVAGGETGRVIADHTSDSAAGGENDQDTINYTGDSAAGRENGQATVENGANTVVPAQTGTTPDALEQIDTSEQTDAPAQMPTYEEWNKRREGERVEEMKQYQKRSSPFLMLIAGFCLMFTAFQNFRAARAMGFSAVPARYLVVMAMEFVAGFCLFFVGFRNRQRRKQEEMEEARAIQEARAEEKRQANEKARQERLAREQERARQKAESGEAQEDDSDAYTEAPVNEAPGSLASHAAIVARLRERELAEPEEEKEE